VGKARAFQAQNFAPRSGRCASRFEKNTPRVPRFPNIKERAMTDLNGKNRDNRKRDPESATVDMKFEIVVIPVSDVDRAKRFYSSLVGVGCDFAAGDDYRVIQFTPPGLGCSVIFGKNVTAAAPAPPRDCT